MVNTNTTLVSKHQLLDYVSKRDFSDFVAEMRDFRGVTESRFDMIDARFTGVDKRFDTIDARFIGVDKRFDTIDARFIGVDKRFDVIEQRLDGIDIRLSGIDKRFNDMDRKLDKLGDDVRIQVGAVLDQFKENMQINREHMQVVEDRLTKKIEERR